MSSSDILVGLVCLVAATWGVLRVGFRKPSSDGESPWVETPSRATPELRDPWGVFDQHPIGRAEAAKSTVWEIFLLVFAALDLKAVPKHENLGWLTGVSASGLKVTFDVDLGLALEGDPDCGQSARIAIETGLHPAVEISREGPSPKKVDDAAIEGFKSADGLCWSGPAVPLYSSLGADARRALARLFAQEEQVHVSSGRVVIGLRTHDLEAEYVEWLTRAGLEAAELLGRNEKAPEHRLLESTFRDPEPGFRSRCLAMLTRHFGDRPETRAACEQALSDPVPAVRLVAASFLSSAQATAQLRAFVEDVTQSEALRAEALTGWAGRAPLTELERVLESLAETARKELLIAVCKEATRIERGVEIVQRIPALQLDAGDATRVIAHLANAQHTGAQSLLLPLLKHPMLDVRVRSAQALGAVGSIENVPALREAAEGVFTSSLLKGAVDEAVRAIQERASNAVPGALALADTASGQVSLSPSESRQGQLSLENKD